MNALEHIAKSLEGNLGMLDMTLGDFSDADMLVRPTAGANHAAWQLGHLIAGENGLMAACGAKMPALPEGFAAKFTKETAGCDDPARFPKKAELIALFKAQRAATAAWVRGLSEADLDKPAPERMRAFVPTLGQMTLFPSGHFLMHLGQFQVIRRKLGRPVLF